MENQRNFLIIALLAISAVLYFKWLEFSNPGNSAVDQTVQVAASNVPGVPSQTSDNDPAGIPAAPVEGVPAVSGAEDILGLSDAAASDPDKLITVNTDLVVAVINTQGGVIERLELKQEPVTLDAPEQGFPLLKKERNETFITEDGLFTAGDVAPNHQTQYQSASNSYNLGTGEQVVVPLTWVAKNGIRFTKTITFTRDSYVVDIDYQVENTNNEAWSGYIYAQFNRTQPEKSGGGFGQLPSYTGGAIYEEEEKYQKIDFKDMSKEKLDLTTNNGWVGMLQHYFVGVWMPSEGSRTYFSTAGKQANPHYRIGYKSETPVVIAAGQNGSLGTKVFLGSKEQSRLKRIEKEQGIDGLAKTVDFGVLTFIADPLFTVLSWIHDIVGNWGWSIILLTLLIKIVFYPLSAASYKSMAGMKKIQPRLKTLKERYKDDRQKFQTEMMALYKAEKINPAGGCLPILIQIPVFIALYWTLLESVELRQAPFALWWTDLSAPDPYYVLPVLMGVSMWAMQKLNPAAMDDIQRKVMMIMPFALTFLFLSFPQGLVLYWVVNNILSMAQQWYINKKYAV